MRRLFAFLVAALLAWPAAALTPAQRIVVLSASGYDSDAQAYFAQASANGCQTGTPIWKHSVSELVKWMKSHALWPTASVGFDAAYLWAVPDTCTGRINLVAPTLKNLTITGSCTFVAYKSIKGNAIDCLLSTGVLTTAFVRFVQDSAHLSSWPLGGTTLIAYTWGQDGTGRVYLRTDAPLFRINATANITDTAITLPGMYEADRDNSSTVRSYFNGAVKSSDVASASAARSGNTVVLFKSTATFSDAEISMAAIGSSQTAQQASDWYAGVCHFMAANAVANTPACP